MAFVNISGATASNYTLVTADLGAQMRCVVTATNSAGSASANAAQVGPVTSGGGGGTSTWSRIPMGPGGFISGFSFHADGTKVCRMDTSGAYRWNAAASRWDMMVTANSITGDVGSIPATDTDQSYGTNPGVYEIAIAPSDSSRIYMMWAHGGDGRVWRSDNRGTSFTKTTRATDTFDANDAWRGAGRKLAVDPINKDVVICGGPIGASLSTDAGATYVTISTSQIPAATSGWYLFAFDPSSAQTGGKTQGIYCFSYGNGIYKSANGGTTWALAASGGPTLVSNLVVGTTGIVYAIRDVVPPYELNVYRLISGTWSTVSTGTAGANGSIATGLAIDPGNPTHMVTLNENGNLSYSGDNGATWSGYGDHFTDFGAIGWLNSLYGGDGLFGLSAGCVFFDPALSNNTVQIGHGLGTARGIAPTTAVRMNWLDNSVGLEQLCAKRILKPPGGQIIMAVMDQGMFRVDGTHYPSTKGILPYFCAAWDAAYCPTDALTIIGGLNQSKGGPADQSGYSRDGGVTWSPFASTDYNAFSQPHAGAMVACGTNRDNFVICTGDYGTDTRPFYYTANGGTSWTASTFPGDVPASGDTGFLTNYYYTRHTICGDTVAADTFYARNGYTGKFYKSTNKGAAFLEVTSALFSTYANARLQTAPGQSGHVYYSTGYTGFQGSGVQPLQRSVDGGSNWISCGASGVTEVICLGFGKAVSGGYPAIYIVGWVSGVYGIYRSDDTAVSWSIIGDHPMGCFDTPVDITGDMDTYGVCNVSSGASGIFKYAP